MIGVLLFQDLAVVPLLVVYSLKMISPGVFLITSAGLAGRVSADVALNIPGGNFSGNFSLAINNTNAAVSRSFTTSGTRMVSWYRKSPCSASP